MPVTHAPWESPAEKFTKHLAQNRGPVGLGQTAPQLARWVGGHILSACWGRSGSGHSLVVVIFHKLLELLDVAYGLQVLLHVGQGCEVICKRCQNPEA